MDFGYAHSPERYQQGFTCIGYFFQGHTAFLDRAGGLINGQFNAIDLRVLSRDQFGKCTQAPLTHSCSDKGIMQCEMVGLKRVGIDLDAFNTTGVLATDISVTATRSV